MKNIIVLFLTYLCAGTLLIGCGSVSEDQVMAKLADANIPEKLLEQHDNLMIQYELPSGDYYIYTDEETFLSDDKSHSFSVLISPEEHCEVGFLEDGTPYFDRYVDLFNDNPAAMMRGEIALTSTTADETVTSMKEENGILFIETRLPAADTDPEAMEALGLSLAEGDFYVCHYEAEAKTYRLLTSEESILRADGISEPVGRVTYSVNVERLAYIAELEAEGDRIDALPDDQSRTLTFIVDPGLETERTVSKKVSLGNYIGYYMTSTENYAFYADAEGTQPHIKEEGREFESGNTTIYVIKTE